MSLLLTTEYRPRHVVWLDNILIFLAYDWTVKDQRNVTRLDFKWEVGKRYYMYNAKEQNFKKDTGNIILIRLGHTVDFQNKKLEDV